MHKLENGKYAVVMLVWPEEKQTVRSMILASGKTESSFLREMVGLDPKRRGAPLGNQNRRGKKKRTSKPIKPRYAGD
jgi:dihydroorotase-like cyclic amidohydrolase